ncbi:hypothetical protein CANARDRAFT_201368 [[Candida] arabinofermentans NRRL YB-2248]|uniref:Major facilitator superfamily (MFS) profile domain-containing protein n=1 Tax=[Candida] arabinofermentans NRRL YB-2248 TaxID=983967 RepID=A0A1E4SXD1_9ASCO|nr:hypothetical protein CANARDRAFT_201368 [[Candida] arabinofermentans NRRL YB-2248]
MSTELQDQSQRLPRKTLMITLGCLTASLFVSFFDQTAITTAIPTIGSDMKNSSLINSWTGTSYLISNTNFQLLYGRISDVFGRKQVFLFSLLCLFVGNLVSGFANNPTLLFVFRAISGLGGGGVNCLVMITFSDLLTTRERGKYFGFVAVSTALGNGAGPLIGGVLTQDASWRWAFWISCPVCIACSVLVIFFVPLKPVTGSLTSKLKMIDWAGFLFSMISTVLFLVSISGGGDSWSWNSAVFISLIVISGLGFFAFLYSEMKLASIPMIPLRLFAELHRAILFAMCFMMGWAYFVDIYYYPLYLQNLRGWSPIMAGVIQLPATCSSSIFGVFAGFVNTATGRYVECLWFGGAMWTLGVGLKIMFQMHSSVGLLVGANLVQGLGIGFTFQPTLLALLSHSDAADRSVVTGLRNFFRCFGGAVGMIISGLIFRSTFKSSMETFLTDNSTLILNIIGKPSIMRSLDDSIKSKVLHSYLQSYKIIMIILTALSGVMFLVSIVTKDGKDTNCEQQIEDQPVFEVAESSSNLSINEIAEVIETKSDTIDPKRSKVSLRENGKSD